MSKLADAVEHAAELADDEIAPAFSEEALALHFAALHADNLRFVEAWRRWLLWDGVRWNFDDTRDAWSLAREVCREAAAQVNHATHAKAIASARTRAAVISLASEDRRLAATVGQWDADPWLLNTPHGVVNLRTGKRRDHRPDDFMTKVTAVAPNATCRTPLWSKFLATVTDNDKELQAFLARMCGYALTGSIREHALFFFHGLGANGKGVAMGAIAGVMGDYHRAAPIEAFTATHQDRHPTELAMLRGARLVTAVETEEGRRWAESRIKMLTGGDRIAARFMRQDFFEYDPQFKLLIAGNHRPGLRSVDEAIRRRFNMIPFAVTIPPGKRDKDLGDKLKSEWPGILDWMIKGCVQWQQIGLAPPVAVTQATADSLEAEDALKCWLDECTVERDEFTPVGVLYQVWKEWAEASGEFVGSAKRFSQRLGDHGFKPERGDQRGFRGLSIYKDAEGRCPDGTPRPRERIWKGNVI
jgi:putative DNA primase/helicase